MRTIVLQNLLHLAMAIFLITASVYLWHQANEHSKKMAVVTKDTEAAIARAQRALELLKTR